MKVSKKWRNVLAGFALGALGAAAGVAYAMWSAQGSGSGRASAAFAVDAEIVAADGTPDLFPGATDGDIAFTVTNPNPYPITFTAATVGAVTSSDEAACPATNVTVAEPGALDIVAEPGTSEVLTIPDVVGMDVDAPDGCQGVTFDIELTLTGTQSTATP